MKDFKLYNNDRLPAPKHSATKMYSIKLSDLNPSLSMPEAYRGQQYLADFLLNCTLCNPKVGMFGRTASLRGSKEPQPANEIKLDDWVLFHSDIDLVGTYLICEVIITVLEKVTVEGRDTIKKVDNIGMGVIAVQLVNAEGNATGVTTCTIKLASPRSFVFLDKGISIEKKLQSLKDAQVSKDNKNPYKIQAEVKEIEAKPKAKFSQLLIFVRENTLVCHHDTIPGVEGDRLPEKMSDKFLDDLEFNNIAPKWVHNVRFTTADEQ